MNPPRAAAVERQPVKPQVRPPRVAAAVLALLPLALCLLPDGALAQSLPGVTSKAAAGGGQVWSLSIQTLVLLTSLSFLPAAMLMMTGFTRIIIVLGLLRSALGTASSPPNQVLVGLSLFLTFFVMSPVFDQAWAAGIAPYLNDQMDFRSAWTAASEPFRGFMLAQIRENDLMTFAGLSNSGPYATPQDVPFSVLAASFLTSELKTAFEIAFLIYIPFVIIDLVVASVLMSMGMMMLSPMLISAPFKILLFVLVDGWVLVVGSLAASFNPV